MENPNADKVETVNLIKELLANSDAAILTEYRGMSVGQLAALRRQLRPAATARLPWASTGAMSTSSGPKALVQAANSKSTPSGSRK